MDNRVTSTKYEEWHRVRLQNHGFYIETLGWSKYTSQKVRFEVLETIGDLSNKSILDVGCGFGDFYDYLKKRDISIKYSGCDIIYEFVCHARKKYPKVDFQYIDIMDLNKKFDYIIASGIFYLPDNWETRTFAILEKMYSLCNIGIGVNFLSYFTESKAENRFYANPSYILGRIMDRISPKATFRHDYLPNDFTVFVYK